MRCPCARRPGWFRRIAKRSRAVVGPAAREAGVRFAEHGAESAYLEVRPTNAHALALYRSEGFRTVGTRRAYYPGANEREDAFVLSCALRTPADIL